MAGRWMRWLAALPMLLPAWGLWPEAAFSERAPAPRAVAAAAAAVAPDTDTDTDTDDDGLGRVIVKYRRGSALAQAGAGRPRHAARLGRALALDLRDGHVLGRRTQSLRARGLGSRALAARLAAHGDVEWAVPVGRKTVQGVVPNDPFYAAGQTGSQPAVGQWFLRRPEGGAVAAINAEAAWALTTGSPAVTVAVLDTGVLAGHPDLAGKLLPGYDFISRTSNAADGNGRDADASDPGDYSSASDCRNGVSGACSSWHGTQVAGLIGAASDNGVGIASVGRDVMLLPVRVIGQGGGYDDDIIAGMRWAAGLSGEPVANPHPARVLNLSLGSAEACSAAYQDALDELVAARVVVVVAAGNDTGQAVNAPANCNGAIAVAGVRHAGTKVGYSNIGPQVAIAAPAGNCVNTTGACLFPLATTLNLGDTTPGDHGYSDAYRTSLGTSFAAPMVAGTAALMLSANPGLTPAQLRDALQATARPFPTVGAQTANAPTCSAPSGLDQLECYCSTGTCGAGLLDAGAAVARAGGLTTPPVAAFVLSRASPTVGGTLQLDAAPSSAGLAGYQWAVTAGAERAAFTGAVDGRSAALRVSAAGPVEVTLTVRDAAGQARQTTRSFTVTEAPTAVIAASTATPTLGAGAPVALDGRGTQAASGRGIAQYRWSITDGSERAVLTDHGDGTATLRPAAPGFVEVTLEVTDTAGATDSVQQQVLVGAAPQALVVPANASVVAGASLLLDGSASTAAPGHRIVAYAWDILGGHDLAAFSGETSGARATLLTHAVGRVTLRLTVTDDAGGSSSMLSEITVVAAGSGNGGGGGGALGAGWLAGLAAAVWALRRRPG